MDHGQLLKNPNVTDVSGDLKKIGFRLMPLISSYGGLLKPWASLWILIIVLFFVCHSFPYPPEFLDWMRGIFQAPDEFIQSAVKTYSCVQSLYRGIPDLLCQRQAGGL
jgi:hypothetical protein